MEMSNIDVMAKIDNKSILYIKDSHQISKFI